MNNNLDIEVIYGIIKFQRLFRSNLSTLKKLNKKLIFFNELLISLSNSLLLNNNNKIFLGQQSKYKTIIEKLENIKKNLIKIQTPLTVKNCFQYGGITKLSLDIIYISELIESTFKLLAPENINYILKFLIGDDWIYNFNEKELEELLFYLHLHYLT